MDSISVNSEIDNRNALAYPKKALLDFSNKEMYAK